MISTPLMFSALGVIYLDILKTIINSDYKKLLREKNVLSFTYGHSNQSSLHSAAGYSNLST